MPVLMYADDMALISCVEIGFSKLLTRLVVGKRGEMEDKL